jgi:hypothetical protein
MAEHAKICWVEDTAPWVLEDELLRRVSLPLNRKRGAGALVGLALTVSPVHPQPSTTA